jgi:cytochrome c-type biogenesis protein CcmF
MMPEIGLLGLVLSLFFSIFAVAVPVCGLWFKKPQLQTSINFYAVTQAICVVIAYCCLTFCFLTNDFSVIYVYSHSSLLLPWFYRFCAVWGGHEGSMLLWVLVLNIWTLGVVFASQSLSHEFRVRVIVVLCALNAGLVLFLLTTSNPFLRQFEILHTQGRDLNPLLQDPGFLFHPPMLYMGYVGCAVAFAFAFSALWLGRIEPQWAKWTRPWSLAAWCCLTLGITLGSWWAYRELGWGGWWFWDPVENASFMPWLCATALIHALALNEKRQQLNAWTVLLAIMTFSLSLIGTFLVRSGVLVSVHAFAVDPTRGLFILLFLMLVIGGALGLFAVRAQKIQCPAQFSALSRESALLLNHVFLCAAMCTVLLGTVYPLLVDGLGLGKLSVGAPYFNAVFVPLMMPVLLLMGAGVHVHWRQDNMGRLWKHLRAVIALTAMMSLLMYFIAQKTMSMVVFLSLMLASWVIWGTLKMALERKKQRGIRGFGQAFLGMILAHIGVAVTVIGIAVSSGFGIQRDVKMSPGDEVNLAGYSIFFVSESSLTGPNYHGTKACFRVVAGQRAHVIFPEKRLYDVGKMAMTDSAIDVNIFRDIYIALGEPIGKEAWSVRLYYKPCVRWIWAGGILLVIGGIIALTDRRYGRYKSIVNPRPCAS